MTIPRCNGRSALVLPLRPSRNMISSQSPLFPSCSVYWTLSARREKNKLNNCKIVIMIRQVSWCWRDLTAKGHTVSINLRQETLSQLGSKIMLKLILSLYIKPQSEDYYMILQYYWFKVSLIRRRGLYLFYMHIPHIG